jgi:hypothetical protein
MEVVMVQDVDLVPRAARSLALSHLAAGGRNQPT